MPNDQEQAQPSETEDEQASSDQDENEPSDEVVDEPVVVVEGQSEAEDELDAEEDLEGEEDEEEEEQEEEAGEEDPRTALEAVCGGVTVERPAELSPMEVDFGSLTSVQQDIPALLDIDGNQVDEHCDVGYEIEFAPRPKYLKLNSRK